MSFFIVIDSVLNRISDIPDVFGATRPTLRVFWKGQRKSVNWVVSSSWTPSQGITNEPVEGCSFFSWIGEIDVSPACLTRSWQGPSLSSSDIATSSPTFTERQPRLPKGQLLRQSSALQGAFAFTIK